MSSSDHYNTIINTNNDKNDEDDCMVIKKKEQGGETNNDYDINNHDYVEGWEEKDQKMVLVVSVEKDNKASRHALKFAIDRFLMSRNKKIRRNISLILLHVRLHNLTFPLSCYHHDLSSRESSPSSFVEREPDDYELEILSPFRYFCARRQIKFEIVVVEDFDVAQALVDYTVRHRVENLFLGSTSSSSSSANNGFSRLFKNNCCAAKTVVKWVPDFCNVYIVSTQGKLSGVRNARCPLPTIPKHHNQTHPHHHIDLSDDEMESVAESDVSFVSSSEMSTTSSSSAVTTMFNSFSDFTHDQFTPCKPQRRRSTSLCLTHKLKSMEDEIKRLKFEQNNSNQTADVIN